MRNRLADIRKARGVSAVHLAAGAGVTRQAIYAIEAGTYMPNTAVALRIARALQTTVEELFALDDEGPHRAESVHFEPLDRSFPTAAGEPIQICRVGRHTIGVAPAAFPAYLPLADGVVQELGRAVVAVEPEEETRLLIAGCDPALSLLAAHAAVAGVDIVLANANSARSLEWLRAGKIDIAGTHIDEQSVSGRGWTSITFAAWEEGFVVRRGNPLAIRTIEDLTHHRVRFINREEGSGSRRLLDSLLKASGASASRIKGSDTAAAGHLAAAWAVASGQADCCIAAGSAARRFGLDFVPLAAETFNFVLPKRDLGRKSVQIVLELLNRARFRQTLETIAGYDASPAGKTLF